MYRAKAADSARLCNTLSESHDLELHKFQSRRPPGSPPIPANVQPASGGALSEKKRAGLYKQCNFLTGCSRVAPPPPPVKMRPKIKAHRQPGRNGGSEKKSRPPFLAREKESAHTDPGKDTTENQSPRHPVRTRSFKILNSHYILVES